jgi:tRNA-intron endonuclease
MELGYGFAEEGGVLLPDVTAVHLMQRGVLTVAEDGRELDPGHLLNRGLESDPSFFLKYLVYRDMRSRGRKLRAGIGDMPFLWYYDKPNKPSSHLVAIYPRNRSIPLEDLRGLVTTGGRMKKGVFLALVDEEGEVSYYEIKRFGPRASAPMEIPRVDSAQLVGPMAVVWNTEGALSLYREGYFGKPIGIRKPRSMNFERPITLSFEESLYLGEKGRIQIEGREGRIEPTELLQTVEEERNFRERMLVYRLLKDSGLVVKSGMKFGVDFAVYEYGPGLDHAPFLIHVYSAGSTVTPTEIVRAGRLAASVKKKFIVAQVDPEQGLVRMLSFARVKP